MDPGPDLDVADGQGVFVTAGTRGARPSASNALRLMGGIDEAGRGPVIGPLVVAGVAGPDPSLFAELGCKDSKLLTPQRRSALDRAIRRAPGVKVEVRVIEATAVDHERRQGVSLNRIEALRFRDIAKSLGASHIIVDAADTDAVRFGRVVRAGLAKGVKVVSEHKADVNHPVVGAASIVAKVARDAAIAELARRLERRLSMPLGSGYCHDPNTQAFLATWWRQFGELPEGTRHTWATARDLVAPQPTSLDAFFGAKPAGRAAVASSSSRKRRQAPGSPSTSPPGLPSPLPGTSP